MNKLSFIIVILVFCASPVISFAQMSDDELASQRINDRLNRLEKDINIMEKELFKGDDSRKLSWKEQKSAPKIDVRIGELEEQIRKLNGRLEEINFNYNNLSKKIDKIASDIDFRLSAVEKSEVGAGKTVDKNDNLIPKIEKTNNQSASENLDVNGQYERAFEYLRNAEYDKAESALNDFISGNKDSDLISNAYYWLGETFYVRENYNKSAVNFLKGYQKLPKGNKAPDNLLKLGMSLGKLKKSKEACATFKKLSKEFPEADNAIKDKVISETMRLSCG